MPLPEEADVDARNMTSRPLARILAWLSLAFVLAAAVGTLGDETRRYGSTALSFCYAP